MPNWCSNTLMVSGEPEAVAEFLILNGQHTKKGFTYDISGEVLKNPLVQPNAEPRSAFDEFLVGSRKSNDLSFSAMIKGQGHDFWGTKSDVAGDVFRYEYDCGSWKLPSSRLSMNRLEKLEFETAWAPPTRWFETIGAIFKDVDLFLGYSEEGVGEFGVIYKTNNAVVHEKMQEVHVNHSVYPAQKAIFRARSTMPLHRKPGAILRAIWSDDESKIISELNKKTTYQVGEQLKSRWTPLMHACFSGSEKVFKLLLQAGADPSERIDLAQGFSFGVSDICMNLNIQQKPSLVVARQNMLLAAIKSNNSIAGQPLGSGRSLLSFALFYKMGPLIEPLLKLCPIDMVNENNKISTINAAINSMIECFPIDALESLISVIPAERTASFTRQMGRGLLEMNTQSYKNKKDGLAGIALAACLFMRLYDSGNIDARYMKMACKEICLPPEMGNDYVSDEFSAVIASERAMRSIDEIINLHSKKNATPLHPN